MILLYYIILVFGIGLFIYTTLTWNRTRRKIHTREGEHAERGQVILNDLKNKYNLWMFYFTSGEKKIFSKI